MQIKLANLPRHSYWLVGGMEFEDCGSIVTHRTTELEKDHGIDRVTYVRLIPFLFFVVMRYEV